MSTIPPTLLSTNLINKPKSAKRKIASTTAGSNTPTSDTSKKTGSVIRVQSNLQSLLAQLAAASIATNSDGDSFSSNRSTSGSSSSDSRKSSAPSSIQDNDDEDEMMARPAKRARPEALHLSWTTTEARPEKPPLELFDPLSGDYQRTGLVDLPKVTIPSLDYDNEGESQEPPTVKRHRDQPDQKPDRDAFFNFLLNNR